MNEAPVANKPGIPLKNGRALVLAGGMVISAVLVSTLINPLLAIPIVLAAVVAPYWNPERALMVYIVVTLLWPSKLEWEFGPWNWGPSRVFIVILFITWFIYLLRHEVEWPKTPLDLALVLFMSAMLISLIPTGMDMSSEQLFRSLKTFGYSIGEWFLLFFMVTTIPRNWQRARRFIVFILALVSIVALVGIIEYLTGFRFFEWLRHYLPSGEKMISNLHEENLATQTGGMFRGSITRIVSTTISPHEVGTLMAMTIPLLFYFLSYSRTTRLKIVCLAAMVLEASALALTVTRGASIAAILAIVTMSLFSKNNIMRLGIVLTLTVVFLVLAIFPAITDAYLAVSSPEVLGQEQSLQGRFDDWPQAEKLLEGNEIFGIGIGQVTGHVLAYGKTVSRGFYATDNWYLAAAPEIGFFGMSTIVVLWGSILFMLFRKSPLENERAREARDLRIAIMAGAVAFMFMCFSFDAMVFMTVSKFFFLMVGLGWALYKGEQRMVANKADTLF